MAGAIARMYAEMDLRNKGFMKGAREVEHESGRMRKALGSVLSTAGGFLVANVVQKGLETVKSEIGNVIGAAADMGETTSKVNAVFGTGAKGILIWGKNAEATLGMADGAALEATATIGNLFKGIGIGTAQLPVMSKAILQASADLGSFNNIDPGQVFEDLKSGLVGEAEPLRKYGILINEAAVKTKALELGLGDANGALSESEKVQARYALIMEQLGDANGDFAKTAGGAANGARTLTAYIQGLRVWIGGKLLPTYTKVIATTNKFASRTQKLISEGVKPFDAVMRSLHVTLDQVFGKARGDKIFAFLQGIRIEVPKLVASVKAFGAELLGVLIPVLGKLVGILGTVFEFAARHHETLVTLAKGFLVVWGALTAGGVVVAVVTGLLAALASPMLLIIGISTLLAAAYIGNWLGIRDITNSVVGFVVKQITRLVAVLRGGKGLGKALEGLPKPLQKVAILARRLVVLFDDIVHGRWDQVRGDIEKIGKTLGNLFQSIGLKNFGQEFKRAFDLVVTLFGDVITLVGDLIHGRWGKLWGDFLAIVKDIGRLGVEYFRLSLSLWKDIFSGIGELFDAIDWGAVGSLLWKGIKLAFKYSFWLIPGLILDALGSIDWGKISDRGRDVVSWLWTGVASLKDWFVRQIYELPNGIIQVFGNFGSWFFDLGRNVVSGIWSGIASLKDWFIGQVTNFIRSTIPEPVRKLMGIASPSKLMARMGRYTVEGFALGINKSAVLAARASAQMAQNVVNAANGTRMTPNISSPRLAPMGALAGGRGGDTYIIQRGAIQVNGVGDPDTVADRVVKRLTRATRRVKAGQGRS